MAQWVIDGTNARLQSRRDVLGSLFADRITTVAAAKDLAATTESLIEGLDPSNNDPTQSSPDYVVEETWLVLYFHARDNPELNICSWNHNSEANGRKLWSGLPEVRWIGREFWDSPIRMRVAPPWETLDRAQSIANFVNINAFLARQQATEMECLDHSLLALWTLRSALESPGIERAKMMALDFFLPSAAVWIDIAGEQLYTLQKQFLSGGNRGRPGLGGPLWNGMYGFCGERWALWRRRFGELADERLLEPELRDLSTIAEARMKEVEARAVQT